MPAECEQPMIQCTGCGGFVLGTTVDGDLVPTVDACPDCGSDEFVERSPSD